MSDWNSLLIFDLLFGDSGIGQAYFNVLDWGCFSKGWNKHTALYPIFTKVVKCYSLDRSWNCYNHLIVPILLLLFRNFGWFDIGTWTSIVEWITWLTSIIFANTEISVLIMDWHFLISVSVIKLKIIANLFDLFYQ